jgi:L-threonylcarbamoyladenylate synthase
VSPPVVPAAGDPPPAAAVAAAVAALRAGQVVGLPTDTVYGIAADPRSPAATAAVFEVKDRPAGLELPVLVAGLDQAGQLAHPIGPTARALAGRWWPGPLTLVLPRRPGAALHLGGNPDTVGLRCPAHPLALAVCATFGPIATTSANHHGQAPASTAAATAALPGLGLVLDAGPAAGAPSTVVDLTGDRPALLREGALGWAEILAVLDAAGGDGRLG